LISVFCATLLSGCVTTAGGTDVTALASSLPQVKEFLNQYPDAKIVVTLWDSATVQANIDSIRADCGEQFAVADYYKVNVVDPSFTLVVWLDKSSQNVMCAVKGPTSSNTAPAQPTTATTAAAPSNVTPALTNAVSATESMPPLPPSGTTVANSTLPQETNPTPNYNSTPSSTPASPSSPAAACQNLYWYTNQVYCQYKEFCNNSTETVTYHKFSTLAECVASVQAGVNKYSPDTIYVYGKVIDASGNPRTGGAVYGSSGSWSVTPAYIQSDGSFNLVAIRTLSSITLRAVISGNSYEGTVVSQLNGSTKDVGTIVVGPVSPSATPTPSPSPSPSPSPIPASILNCSDSEGMYDYYTKGTTTYFLTDGSSQPFVDFCASSSVLMERYCATNQTMAESSFTCPYQCMNGACVNATPSPSPSPSPSPFPKLSPCGSYGDVDGNGYVEANDADYLFQHIGEMAAAEVARADVNSNGADDFNDAQLISQYVQGNITTFPACSAPSPSPSPTPSQAYTCNDSDGGLNYFLAGTVSYTAPSVATSVPDSCSGNTLYEYYCDDSYLSVTTVHCICSSGACTGSLGVDGACGPAAWVNFSSMPTTGLCSSGNSSAVSGSGPWDWYCYGSNGGAGTSCVAYPVSTPTPAGNYSSVGAGTGLATASQHPWWCFWCSLSK